MLAVEHPFSLVLFGASGHLAKIKIFPSLYFLALKKRFPKDYALVGYARTPMTDEQFQAHVAEAIRSEVLEVNEIVLKEFISHVRYATGQYDQVADFQALAKKLDALEAAWPETVRLAYLSIPPLAFKVTLQNICKGGVHDRSKPFRCIVEKPVGTDIKSFEGINDQLVQCFRPEETYILDHYLGKEAVRSVYDLRHANPIIERLLKNTLISHVQILAAESAGLEGRAGYFDAVGTLRDMFQSHLLEIVSLLTMRLVGDHAQFRANRLDAIRKLYIPPSTDLSEILLQGQYAAGAINEKPVLAYSKEEGVPQGSRTATYAALKLLSRSSRWEGVPFFLRSGKRLKAKETHISIEFLSAPSLTDAVFEPNRLDIILHGEAGMRIYLQTKLGGSEPKFRPLTLEDPLVCFGDCLPEHSLLLLEAINGNQQWFLDAEEVRSCWRLIDPLQKYLSEKKTPLALYPAGSQGPKEADTFIAHHGHRWF